MRSRSGVVNGGFQCLWREIGFSEVFSEKERGVRANGCLEPGRVRELEDPADYHGAALYAELCHYPLHMVLDRMLA